MQQDPTRLRTTVSFSRQSLEDIGRPTGDTSGWRHIRVHAAPIRAQTALELLVLCQPRRLVSILDQLANAPGRFFRRGLGPNQGHLPIQPHGPFRRPVEQQGSARRIQGPRGLLQFLPVRQRREIEALREFVPKLLQFAAIVFRPFEYSTGVVRRQRIRAGRQEPCVSSLQQLDALLHRQADFRSSCLEAEAARQPSQNCVDTVTPFRHLTQ